MELSHAFDKGVANILVPVLVIGEVVVVPDVLHC